MSYAQHYPYRHYEYPEPGVNCLPNLICGERQTVKFLRYRERALKIAQYLAGEAKIDGEEASLAVAREELCSSRLHLGFIFANLTAKDMQSYCVWEGSGWTAACVTSPNLRTSFSVISSSAWQEAIDFAEQKLNCPLDKSNAVASELFICAERCTTLGINPLVTPFLWLLVLVALMIILLRPQHQLEEAPQHAVVHVVVP